MPKKKDQRYYIAGGKRIRLKADAKRYAVRMDHPAVRALSAKVRSHLKREGRELAGKVVLIASDLLGPEYQRTLDEAGALMPVFREGEVTLVALPEIRAEWDDEKQNDAIRGYLKDSNAHEIDRNERRGHVTFSPPSGRADDALTMAVELFDRAKPAASTVRFLRVVPKPR